MIQPVRIAIVGDYNQNARSHIATNKALTHTAEFLSIPLDYEWLPTQTLSSEGSENTLRKFHNPKFRDKIEKGQLKIAGVDFHGEARVVEISDHPFYVGALYLPQISSAPGSPHPLIVAYLRAVLAIRTSDSRKV